MEKFPERYRNKTMGYFQRMIFKRLLQPMRCSVVGKAWLMSIQNW